MDEEQCINCRFGEAVKTSFAEKTLECRRYPPKQDGTKSKSEPFPFPIVLETCWCGEWKA